MGSYLNASLVSIIIPTYNHAKFLKEAVNSILNQTYKNREIIIINNYSEDITIEVVNNFKNEKIALINFRNNGIIAASRNIRLKASKGEYIAFLDSDDIGIPKKLERQIEKFNENRDLFIIGTNLEIFPNGRKNALKIGTDIKISFYKLLQNNYFINSSILIKKEIINSIGFLDEDNRLRTVEDYDYWLRILKYKDNSGLILKDDLIKYRIHKSNPIGVGFGYDFLAAYKKEKIILEKHLDYNPGYIQKLLKLKEYKAIKGSIRFKFYRRETYSFELLKNVQIKLIDRLEILFKGYVIFLFRLLRFRSFG